MKYRMNLTDSLQQAHAMVVKAKYDQHLDSEVPMSMRLKAGRVLEYIDAQIEDVFRDEPRYAYIEE